MGERALAQIAENLVYRAYFVNSFLKYSTAFEKAEEHIFCHIYNILNNILQNHYPKFKF